MRRIFSANIFSLPRVLAGCAVVAAVGISGVTATESGAPSLKAEPAAQYFPQHWCKQPGISCWMMDFFDLGD